MQNIHTRNLKILNILRKNSNVTWNLKLESPDIFSSDKDLFHFEEDNGKPCETYSSLLKSNTFPWISII